MEIGISSFVIAITMTKSTYTPSSTNHEWANDRNEMGSSGWLFFFLAKLYLHIVYQIGKWCPIPCCMCAHARPRQPTTNSYIVMSQDKEMCTRAHVRTLGTSHVVEEVPFGITNFVIGLIFRACWCDNSNSSSDSEQSIYIQQWQHTTCNENGRNSTNRSESDGSAEWEKNGNLLHWNTFVACVLQWFFHWNWLRIF